MAYLNTDPNMQQQDPSQQQDPNQQFKQTNDSTGGGSAGGITTTSNNSGSGTQSAPQGQSSNAGGTSGSSVSATPSGTASGRFQNLQNYITANSGYNQGQGLAGQVGNSLTTQEQQQSNNINNASTGVVNQANQASAQYQAPAVQSYLQQALANPTNTANNGLTQWQQYYNGTYTAPTAFDNNGSLQQSTQNFQSTAGLANSEPGRMALLNNLYGNPTYTQGQQTLDNLLLQGNSAQLGNLQSTAGNLSNNLQNTYNTDSTNAANAISNGQNLAQQASATTQAALGYNPNGQYTGAIANAQNTLNNTVAQTQAQRQNDYNTALSQLQSGTLSPAVAQELGITGNNPLYNVNPTQYLQNNVGTVGVGNVATAQDQANFQALAQLAGQPTASALGQFATPTTQLGAATTFNNPNFTQAVTNAGNAYNQAYNKLLSAPTYNGTQYIGSDVTNAGDINKDISALNTDITQRNASNGGAGTYVTQDQATIAALQNLAKQYGYNTQTGSFNSLNT